MRESLRNNGDGKETEEHDLRGCGISQDFIIHPGKTAIMRVRTGRDFKIGNKVIIEPCALFTNDKYPIHREYELEDPVIRKGAPIGVQVTVSQAADRRRSKS